MRRMQNPDSPEHASVYTIAFVETTLLAWQTKMPALDNFWSAFL